MRRFASRLIALCCGIAAVFAAGPAGAQGAYPNKPITLLIPFAAGGSTDVTARALAAAAEKSLGQPIVVVNRPGATGTLALTELGKAAPDGYTLATINEIALDIAPHMQKVSFDPLKDFTPILNFGVYTTFVAVSADSPFKTLKELIDYARANPRIVTVGVPGLGASAHLGMARLAQENKVQFTFVPFPGGAPTTSALLGRHVTVASASGELLPHSKSGKVRLLAMFEDTKLKEFPGVQTLKELGYSWSLNSWVGIGGPAGIDPAIRTRLYEAFRKAMDSQEFKSSIESFQMLTIADDPRKAAEAYRRSYEEMGAIIRELGIGNYAKPQ
jgi:tripartite-type tricarboxylate transporter receptor subunit TctC